MSGVGAWIRYGEALQSHELEFAAAHYRVAILQPWEVEAAAFLKERRPDMTVLAYRCLSSVRNFEPPERQASGVSYQAAVDNDWLARRLDGSLIEWNTYPGHFQTTVWEPAYRKHWVDRLLEDFCTSPFDGIMADNDVFEDYYGLSLPIAGMSSWEDMRKHLGILVSDAGMALGSLGKILVPNIAESRREQGRWQQHAAWGGGFDECWLGWGDNQFFDEATALTQVDQLGGPGLSIMRTPDGGDELGPGALYGLAAFWVFGGGRGAYAATGHDDYSRTPWFAQLDVDLGEPLGPPTGRHGVWRRKFSHGLAVVNLRDPVGPSAGRALVRLPEGARSWDDAELARRVRLEAKQGLLVSC